MVIKEIKHVAQKCIIKKTKLSKVKLSNLILTYIFLSHCRSYQFQEAGRLKYKMKNYCNICIKYKRTIYLSY